MEYTIKHKNLIAKLFKKAGMLAEVKIVLSCDKYKYEIGKAMRDAAQKANVPIGANPALLDAARRYENRDCAIFKECTLTHCEGGVWCDIYNLGGSHGHIGDRYRYLGKSAFDVPLSDRRKLMLEMLEYKTQYKPANVPSMVNGTKTGQTGHQTHRLAIIPTFGKRSLSLKKPPRPSWLCLITKKNGCLKHGSLKLSPPSTPGSLKSRYRSSTGIGNLDRGFSVAERGKKSYNMFHLATFYTI